MRLSGGKGDAYSPSDFPKKKVEEGMRVEREHTSDKELQQDITLDHLSEDPEYYRKLKKVEKSAAYAYQLGQSDALRKYAGASASPAANDGASKYRDSGSPVATTHHRDSAQNVSQNFRYNASLGPTSGMTDPGFSNNVMRGGTPTLHDPWDTTGGLK